MRLLSTTERDERRDSGEPPGAQVARVARVTQVAQVRASGYTDSGGGDNDDSTERQIVAESGRCRRVSRAPSQRLVTWRSITEPAELRTRVTELR